MTGFRNDFSGDGRETCGARLTVGTYYVLFADVAHGRLVAKDKHGALVEWTDSNERAVWHGLGEYDDNFIKNNGSCAVKGPPNRGTYRAVFSRSLYAILPIAKYPRLSTLSLDLPFRKSDYA